MVASTRDPQARRTTASSHQRVRIVQRNGKTSVVEHYEQARGDDA